MPAGGRRAGAGRKPNAEVYKTEILSVHDAIAACADALVQAKLRLALGVTVQDVDDDTGGVAIYTRPPSGKDIEYLLNRLMGTPVQHVEAETKTSGTRKIVVEYRNVDPTHAPRGPGEDYP